MMFRFYVLCSFVRHVAPDVLALSFKLIAETSFSVDALRCNGADECQESTNTLQSKSLDRFTFMK